MMDLSILEAAHRHSMDHRMELFRSSRCGCFSCAQTFAVSAVEKWIDKGETALCPRCGVDAVIGSAAGYALTPSFLEEMHDYWFGN